MNLSRVPHLYAQGGVTTSTTILGLPVASRVAYSGLFRRYRGGNRILYGMPNIVRT